MFMGEPDNGITIADIKAILQQRRFLIFSKIHLNRAFGLAVKERREPIGQKVVSAYVVIFKFYCEEEFYKRFKILGGSIVENI
jgi:hypothetical protein